jgi:hypothetical protein
MAKAIISLDEQQIARLEMAVLDKDIDEAWKLLTEIRDKVRATQSTRCGIDKLRSYSKDVPA